MSTFGSGVEPSYKDIDWDCEYKRIGDYIVSSGYKVKSDIDNLICHLILEYTSPDYEESLSDYGFDGNVFNTFDALICFWEENNSLEENDYYA